MAEKSKQTKSSRQILNGSQERVTNQRTLLLDLIRKNNGHIDADELYHKARQQNSRLSLSTVYRNLQLFKKMGLVDEYHFADEHHHYEVKPSTKHQHLICLSCGEIVEFKLPFDDQLRGEIGRQYGFEVSDIQVNLKGLCSRCSQKIRINKK
jgi:Fur family ferric uptake transcriptional regulator